MVISEREFWWLKMCVKSCELSSGCFHSWGVSVGCCVFWACQPHSLPEQARGLCSFLPCKRKSLLEEVLGSRTSDLEMVKRLQQRGSYPISISLTLWSWIWQTNLFCLWALPIRAWGKPRRNVFAKYVSTSKRPCMIGQQQKKGKSLHLLYLFLPMLPLPFKNLVSLLPS